MDGSGAVIDTWDYDAFGNAVGRTGNTDNSFTYRGEQMDSTLRLQYLRARWMDPSKGRFWTTDGSEGEEEMPITTHRYLYANDDAIENDDPSGFEASIGEVSFDFDMSVAPIGLPGRGGGGGSKRVQITIDDAPGNSDSEMGSLLKENGIRTMFFVEGAFVQRRPGDLKALLAEGHKLGNHSWNHENFAQLSAQQVIESLRKTEDIVRRVTGISMKPNWRAPYGSLSGRASAAAASIGYTKQWKWDVDSEDWKTPGQTGVILQKVEDGLRSCPKQTCQMLFHDRSSTVRSLRTIIPTLKAEGYKLVDFP
jgi:RHS repeat-associated protein